MREVFIVTPSKYDLRDFHVRASEAGFEAIQRGPVLSVGEDNTYVDVTELPEVAEHFDEDERETIRSCGANPRFYRIRFHDPAIAARVILHSVPHSPDFVLDNDHGLVISFDDFASLFKDSEGWDWSLSDAPPGEEAR